MRPFGPEPAGRPVERAEKGARRDERIVVPELARTDAGDDEVPDAAFVPIALGDDRRAQAGRQRSNLEMRGRSFDFIEQAEDVRDGEIAEAIGQRSARPARPGQGVEQPVERAVLAEVEQFVLAAKVVVEVARGEIGRVGDVAHAGGGEAHTAERLRGGAQDCDAAGLGAS